MQSSAKIFVTDRTGRALIKQLENTPIDLIIASILQPGLTVFVAVNHRLHQITYFQSKHK